MRNLEAELSLERILEDSISQDFLEDPVTTVDGMTYSTETINEWFIKHNTSPKTNNPLPDKSLIKNHFVAKVLETPNIHNGDNYLDPITHKLIEEPIIARNGVTYDKTSWLQHVKKNPCYPHSQELIKEKDKKSETLIVNFLAKNILADYAVHLQKRKVVAEASSQKSEAPLIENKPAAAAKKAGAKKRGNLYDECAASMIERGVQNPQALLNEINEIKNFIIADIDQYLTSREKRHKNPFEFFRFDNIHLTNKRYQLASDLKMELTALFASKANNPASIKEVLVVMVALNKMLLDVSSADRDAAKQYEKASYDELGRSHFRHMVDRGMQKIEKFLYDSKLGNKMYRCDRGELVVVRVLGVRTPCIEDYFSPEKRDFQF